MKNQLFARLAAGLWLLGLPGCRQADPGHAPAVHFDALYVVNGASNTVSVIAVDQDQVVRTIKLGEAAGGGHAARGLSWPHHIYLNGANSQLAIGAPGMDMSAGHHDAEHAMPGKVALLDPVSGDVLHVLQLPAMNHNAIYSPDGQEIWTAQMVRDGRILVYDAATLALKTSLAVGRQPTEITFSADGSLAFVANGADNTVTVVDPVRKTIRATIPVGAGPVGAWPGADHKMYVDNEDGKSISVIDAAGLRVEETVPLAFVPAYVAYRPGAHAELWVSDPDGGRVHYFTRVHDAWTPRGDVATGAGAHALVFSRDGGKLYVTNQAAGTVSVLDATHKQKLKDIAVGLKPNGLLIRYP